MQLKTGSRCQYYPSRNLELEAINSRGGTLVKFEANSSNTSSQFLFICKNEAN